MTDKEHIIIDGIDVSGCIYLPYCEDKQGNCGNNPNCYFKQLQRKTQECEELKKQLMQKDEVNTFFNTPIEGWSSNPCDICESKNNYEQLTQECDTLKSQLDFEVQQKEGFEQKCEQLQEKYEALKLENQEGYEIVAELKHECEELQEKCEELKEDRYNLNMEMYVFERYRKALDEIEEYIKEEEWSLLEYIIRDINNIINKAKDGKND